MKQIYFLLIIATLSIGCSGCCLYESKQSLTIDDLDPEDYRDDPRLKELVLTMQNNKKTITGSFLAMTDIENPNPKIFDVLIIAQNSKSDKNKYVRSNACLLLGFLGDERAIEPLINSLQDKAWLVRHSSCLALGFFEDTKVVDALIKMLDDESYSVKFAACDSLADIGDKRALNPIRKLLNHKSELVKKEAKRTIAKFKAKGIE